MSGSLGDFRIALKLRDIIRRLVAIEIRKSGLLPRYGVVQDIDRLGSKALVLMNAESEGVWVVMNAIEPQVVGQVVRVLGPSGDMYIDTVVSEAPFIGVGNSQGGSTLGTVIGKYEIFDASGASLGFVPRYDAIT